jgi:hypothetical protein
MHDQQMKQAGLNTVRTIDRGEHQDVRLAELVVHVNDDIDEEQCEDFEQEMRSMHGVLDLSFCRNRHHLMIIQYHPELVTSCTIIEQVRRLAGMAQLIGPI